MKWADVSEWQGTINWPSYGLPIACSRLLYGTSYVDKFCTQNVQGSRRNVANPGWYHYLVAGQDAVAQAKAFCSLLDGYGGLRPNEWAMLDYEEGGLDSVNRALAWRNYVEGHYGAGRTCIYSFLNMYQLQLAGLPGDWPKIVAAYGATKPPFGFAWQYSSSETFSGISGPCDANVSSLTGETLLSSLGVLTETPTPIEEDNTMDSLLIAPLASGTVAIAHVTGKKTTVRLTCDTFGDGLTGTVKCRVGIGGPNHYRPGVDVDGRQQPNGSDPYEMAILTGGQHVIQVNDNDWIVSVVNHDSAIPITINQWVS
jgi:hypothetical protein